MSLIVFSIVSLISNRNFDSRYKYGHEIAAHIELKNLFEDSYLGGFGFDEALTNEHLRKDVESSFDRGVESRLAFYLAERLPKWVLKAAHKDIEIGQFSFEASCGRYIGDQIVAFAELRCSQLSDLLKNKATSKPHPDRRRRRRR